MPKGRTKKTSLRSAPLKTGLLLVKNILITIGNVPVYIVSIIIGIFAFFFHFVQPSRKRGRPKKFRLSKRTKILLGISISVLFILIYTFLILTAAYQLPTPTRLASPNEPLTTEFYDRNGILLYRLYEGKNRTLVKLAEVPQHFIQATLAIEDKNFYHHLGIDPVAIVRALYRNLTQNTQEGASTLTQQLIKNSLLTPEKSYSRKIREIILALWAERVYSKEQILQMYFNEAPYGGSLVGIAAAAHTYFGKLPQQLSLAESAFLAGLPASPTQLSPYGENPNLAKIRQKEVLEAMTKTGYITQSQADNAAKEELKVRPQTNGIAAPHFVFYIKDLLSEKYGPKIVAQGGLKIYTSLDLAIQEEVEKIVSSEIDSLSSLNAQNGAAMVLEAKTGQILAMVGSRDYHYPGFGNYNVTTSLRQPGSSIKPVTYATAFSKGFNPGSMILDTSVTFKDEWGNGYSPVNYDGRFHGPVTLREALGSSFNIPAVKLLATVGVDSFIKTARDLGISTFDKPQQYGLAVTLGGAEVKMIEMMGLYNTFAQMGEYLPPSGILKITDSKGHILEEYQNQKKQVLTSQIAYLITNILADDKARSMAFGINSLLNIPGYEVAVKTGTSDNKRDNWTFGYTPKFVVGVWVGNPDNSPMNPNLASGITGAAPIWNKIMKTLLAGTQPVAFEKPSGLAENNSYGRKDLNLSGVIPKAMVRVHKAEDKIIFSDDYSSYATTSAQANPVQPNL